MRAERGLGPPGKEKAPSGSHTARANSEQSADTNTFKSTDIPGYQPTEAPTAEDRADAEVLAAAAARGYRLAVRCIRCNQWLVARSSVARHLGPVCATKAVAA